MGKAGAGQRTPHGLAPPPGEAARGIWSQEKPHTGRQGCCAASCSPDTLPGRGAPSGTGRTPGGWRSPGAEAWHTWLQGAAVGAVSGGGYQPDSQGGRAAWGRRPLLQCHLLLRSLNGLAKGTVRRGARSRGHQVTPVVTHTEQRPQRQRCHTVPATEPAPALSPTPAAPLFTARQVPPGGEL